MTDRIQKVLASAGIGSRRGVEKWIEEGRISVNGRPAEIGQKVDHNDSIRVDGRLVSLTRKAPAHRVILFKKMTGELVTRADPDGRRTVFRKLPKLDAGRWIAVGRLDINTSGLLLMTTDGELARRLTHPSFEVPRVYAVRVLGELDRSIQSRLTKGVRLEDGVARCKSIRRVESPDAEERETPQANRWYEVTMLEGRNRIVRRLFEAVDLQVSRLIRISYGPINLGGGIKAGSFREASESERVALYQSVNMDVRSNTSAGETRKPSAPRGRSAASERPAKKPRR